MAKETVESSHPCGAEAGVWRRVVCAPEAAFLLVELDGLCATAGPEEWVEVLSLSTLNYGFSLNPQPSTPFSPLSTLNPRPSTINPQPQPLSPTLKTLNPESSTLDPKTYLPNLKFEPQNSFARCWTRAGTWSGPPAALS